MNHFTTVLLVSLCVTAKWLPSSAEHRRRQILQGRSRSQLEFQGRQNQTFWPFNGQNKKMCRARGSRPPPPCRCPCGWGTDQVHKGIVYCLEKLWHGVVISKQPNHCVMYTDSKETSCLRHQSSWRRQSRTYSVAASIIYIRRKYY